jgi:hypothetical protein
MADVNGAVSSDLSPLFYDIFGELIEVRANDEAVRRRIASTLSVFHHSGGKDPCSVFYLMQRDSESPILQGQQFNDGKLLTIADRYKLITASLGAKPWQIHAETFGRNDEYVYYYVFEPLLLMVLKRCNLVPWHAAAVSCRGTIVLIVGESGSGKSTTALALLLRGGAFIADDELFLVPRDGGVGVRSAERALHFADTTAALVRGSVPLELPLVRRGSGMKRRLDVDTDSPNGAAQIGIVLFPHVESHPNSTLTRLPAAEAMRRLISLRPKEYPAAIKDAASLERQFAACTTLASTAKSFDLGLGRDIGSLSQLVDEVIG